MPIHLRSACLPGLCLAALLVLGGCAEPAPKGQPDEEQPVAEAISVTPEESASSEAPPVPETAEDSAEPKAELATASDAVAPSLEVPTEPEAAETKSTIADAKPPAPLPASKAPLPYDQVDTANLSMPKVVFSDHHAAMSKVGVGDSFPNLELPNLDGQKRSLTELLGPKLTLVVFWDAAEPTAIEELSDLTRYHLPRFGDKGLSVVAINSGDKPQLAHELAQHAGTSYPVLSDADGEALQQVASGKLPRTYLLDPSGKIVWFDIEYSPTTRRDLAAAIRVSLAQ